MNLEKARVYFPKKSVRYTPEFTSRRFGRAPRFVARAYKSDGDDDDDDDKEERKSIISIVTKAVKKQLETRAKAEDVEAISNSLKELLEGKDGKNPFPLDAIRELADPDKGALKMITEQGLALQALQTQLNSQPKDMSIRAQVKAWQKDNKEAITKIRSGQMAELKPLDLRVASPMSVATVNAGSSPYIGRVEGEATPTEMVRAEPMFWDFLTKGRTGAPTYYWVNKTNPLGAAAFIGPGITKPGISLALEAATSNAKKIADSAKAQTELLDDIDGFTSFIEQELKYQVMIKVNEQLMTGTASSTNPAGIQSLSSAFTVATIKTTNPTYVDCLRAVVGQLRSGWLKGPIDIFINSIDAANMDIAKATDSGVYLLPPFVTANGMQVSGARVHEDNNVPVGYVQAAFLRFYRVLVYKDFYITWGLVNDDLLLNLVTVIGEMRLHQFFNEQYTGAFVYDSFENITTAITKA